MDSPLVIQEYLFSIVILTTRNDSTILNAIFIKKLIRSVTLRTLEILIMIVCQTHVADSSVPA